MRTVDVPASLKLEHFREALAEMSAEHESLTRSLLGDGTRPEGDDAEVGFEPGPPIPSPIVWARMARRRGRFFGPMP